MIVVALLGVGARAMPVATTPSHAVAGHQRLCGPPGEMGNLTMYSLCAILLMAKNGEETWIGQLASILK